MAASVIGVTDDAGRHWTLMPQRKLDGDVRLEAIDPTNPDRLVLSVASMNTTELRVSTDRGEHSEPYLLVHELRGVAAASDGRFWFGDSGDLQNTEVSAGVWYASRLTASPVQLADYRVGCVGYNEASGRLYACQAWSFGEVDQVSGEFHALIAFDKLSKLVECPDRDVPAACEAQLCSEYCGATHFADASVCHAYAWSSCGGPSPEAARSTTTTDGSRSTSGQAESAADNGDLRVGVANPPQSGCAVARDVQADVAPTLIYRLVAAAILLLSASRRIRKRMPRRST
jgi:hypothetical protein